MRNVVRNILTKWRNVFGKNEIYSYSSIATNPSYTDFTIFTGHNLPVKIKMEYTEAGDYRSYITTLNNYNEGRSLIAVADVGTLVTMTVLQGNITFLQVDGVVIFDNR